MRKYLLTLLSMLSICFTTTAQKYGSFKDSRDGKVYKTVKIGAQEWLAENLNTERFRNGDLIPQAKTVEEMKTYSNAKEPAWCYYNFDPKNGKIYGKLYNGYAIDDSRGLAPKGWHVPSNDEFILLVEQLGGKETARFKLKSKSGWAKGGNGTNSSGFSALPGGISYMDELGFADLGFSTEFSSTTATPGDPSSPDMKFNYILDLSFENQKEELKSPIDGKPFYMWRSQTVGAGRYAGNYFYIRCLKD